MRTARLQLPTAVDEIAQTLAALPGAVAVVLGGSRTAGGLHSASDWDLVVYYRGFIEVAPLAVYGDVYPPGSWGRIMNGGAWLRSGDTEIDVILRDLDVALHWTQQAERGEFELDALLGYLAGLPTYSLAAELASGHVLLGSLPAVGPLPARLAETAPPRWRFARDFSLDYARMHAARDNVVGTVGQAAKAAMEEAHARACERRLWVLNEKRLLADVGLDGLASEFLRMPPEPAGLSAWVDRVAQTLAS